MNNHSPQMTLINVQMTLKFVMKDYWKNKFWSFVSVLAQRKVWMSSLSSEVSFASTSKVESQQ